MPRDDQQGKRGFETTPSADKGQLPTGKSWFFGIGINEYQNFPNLRNARKDITDVLQLLQERYDLDEYRILFDEEATKDSIIDHFQELLESVQENDKLLIYYSGHGYLDRKDRGYWLPYDAQKKRVASYIRNSTLKEFLEDIEARHILLASDSCFSGALLLRDVSYTQAAMEEFERDRSRWVISSGRQREPVADGKPGQNSPFTSSILKILRKNQELKLNAALLFDQVTKLTRFQYNQTPQNAPLVGAGHEGGQYVFRFKAGEQAIWEACIEENTVAAFNRYLDRFPSGKYEKDAINRLEDLEDDQEWDRTNRIDRTFAYRTYLSAFPRGRHVDTARQRIKELEAEITAREEVTAPQPDSRRRPASSKKSEPKSKSTAPNTFTDPRDGQAYKTVELNGLVWMAENLNFDIGESCWFYEDDLKNGEKYGRLYTWEAAKKACPPGWRLPTDEEWKSLAKVFGGYYDHNKSEDVGDPKKAYKAMMEGGNSGFSARLGGYRFSGGSFDNLGWNGYYWSATERASGHAWYYHFDRSSGKLFRGWFGKSYGRSCRCVQDLTT